MVRQSGAREKTEKRCPVQILFGEALPIPDRKSDSYNLVTPVLEQLPNPYPRRGVL